MTEKELKKLNRYQLLEMLIIQTERADELEKKLEAAEAKLDSRDVQMTVIGSIAEASMQLSGVFEVPRMLRTSISTRRKSGLTPWKRKRPGRRRKWWQRPGGRRSKCCSPGMTGNIWVNYV